MKPSIVINLFCSLLLCKIFFNTPAIAAETYQQASYKDFEKLQPNIIKYLKTKKELTDSDIETKNIDQVPGDLGGKFYSHVFA